MSERSKVFNYLKDLEEMSDRGADFDEYYNKMMDGIKDLKGNQRAIFVYSLMNAIRDLGFKNGKREANAAMVKFLNCE